MVHRALLSPNVGLPLTLLEGSLVVVALKALRVGWAA